MISGISPGLVKNQKAGGVEVAGKNKVSDKSMLKDNEQKNFADMIPGNKADPKNEARTEVRRDLKSSDAKAKPDRREDLDAQRKNDPRDTRIEKSSSKLEVQGNEKLKGSVVAGPKEIPGKEVREEIKDVPRDVIPGKIGQAATAREKAVLKFMDSFESEFGIPPLRIAEVMAELPPSLQDMSPMETATDVVEGLSLSDAEEQRALDMYAGFLMQLQTLEQRPSVMPDIAMAGGFGASSMLLAKDGGSIEGLAVGAKNQALQKYRDLSEDGSAGKVSAGVIGAAAAGAFALGSLGKESGEALASGAEASVAMSETPAHLANALSSEGKASALAKGATPEVNGILAKMQQAAAQNGKGQIDLSQLQGMKSSPELNQKVMDALSQNANAATSGMAKGGLENSPQALQGLAASLAGIAALSNNQQQDQSQFSQQFSGQGQNASDSSSNGAPDFFMKETKPTEFKDALSSLDASQNVAPMQPQNSSVKFHSLVAAAPAVIVQGDPSTPPVQQMITSAEMLIRQGGGEMKVQLNPEGLGIVDLKIALQDGKLSVNMAAEEKETKKLLESTMSELRSSLNAKHFAVDSIKIDMIHSAKTDNDARSATDQNPDRGSSKQFWQQFQESFGNRSRQNDLTGWADSRGGTQKRYDPLGSVDAANKASTSQSPRVMTSQRLNMVA